MITRWLYKVSYQFIKYRRKKRICNWGKKHKIRFKKQNKKYERKRKKNESANEALQSIEEILDDNKNAQRYFLFASEVDKGKTEPKTEESIAEKTKLRREKIAEIKTEEKNT